MAAGEGGSVTVLVCIVQRSSASQRKELLQFHMMPDFLNDS